MKAQRLTGIRAMAPSELGDPHVESDTDVIVAMKAVGVCGSDVHYYTHGRIGEQVVEYPFTVGHECAGVVQEVGRGVTELAPGDRVAIDPAMPCGACDQCRSARPHTCRKLRFLGCPGQAEGSLSEFIAMPASSCFRLDDALSFEAGVLSEPLSIGLYACQLAGTLEGRAIGVLGCGPIGLSVILPARALGARAIYATDRIDARVAMAHQAGADRAGNVDTEDTTAAIAEREPLLLDYVFECCGQQAAVDQAIELLKPGGTLLMIGIPAEDRISFPIDRMRRKEIRFQNVRRQNDCTGRCLEMMAGGRLDAEFMVTHHYAFDETKAAFDLVTEYADGVMKAIVTVP